MSREKRPDDRVNQVKELHNNIRHITQLGMGWFAFIASANYLTMGWLANNPKDSPNRYIIFIVAVVFFVQDILGIFGLAGVIKSTMSMKTRIDFLQGEQEMQPESIRSHVRTPHKLFRSLEKSNSEIPIQLYQLIGLFLMAVLLFLAVAWMAIGIKH